MYVRNAKLLELYTRAVRIFRIASKYERNTVNPSMLSSDLSQEIVMRLVIHISHSLYSSNTMSTLYVMQQMLWGRHVTEKTILVKTTASLRLTYYKITRLDNEASSGAARSHFIIHSLWSRMLIPVKINKPKSTLIASSPQ